MVIFHSYVNVYQYPVPAIHGGKSWKIHHFQPRQETTSGLSSDGRTWFLPRARCWQRKTMGKCREMCGQMMIFENMWLENHQFMISGVKSKDMGYTKCSKKPHGRNRGKKQALFPDQLDAWILQAKHHL